MNYYVFIPTGQPVEFDEPVSFNVEDYREITEEEYNNLLPYDYTAEEQAVIAKQYEIADLKLRLLNTDYQAIKFAEGELSAEDYAPIKLQRQQWRARINELEEQL